MTSPVTARTAFTETPYPAALTAHGSREHHAHALLDRDLARGHLVECSRVAAHRDCGAIPARSYALMNPRLPAPASTSAPTCGSNVGSLVLFWKSAISTDTGRAVPVAPPRGASQSACRRAARERAAAVAATRRGVTRRTSGSGSPFSSSRSRSATSSLVV